MDLCEFEDSLVYRVSSRTVRATQKISVSKNKNNKIRKKKKEKKKAKGRQKLYAVATRGHWRPILPFEVFFPVVKHFTTKQ